MIRYEWDFSWWDAISLPHLPALESRSGNESKGRRRRWQRRRWRLRRCTMIQNNLLLEPQIIHFPMRSEVSEWATSLGNTGFFLSHQYKTTQDWYNTDIMQYNTNCLNIAHWASKTNVPRGVCKQEEWCRESKVGQANMQMDERVAQDLHSDSWLF